MRTISVALSEADYEAFHTAAQEENRPIAQLVREAIGFYLGKRQREKGSLTDLPVLLGHRLITELPTRNELYNELYSELFSDKLE